MPSGLPPLSAVPDRPDVAALLALLEERDALIAVLLARVESLEARLGRNSRNSSQPPSCDGYAKPGTSPTRARQEAAGRKPGKQPGAPGAALRQVEDPDEVVEHAPAGCRGCGAALWGAPVVGVERRQVFDVPAGRPVVVEHRLQRWECACGTVTTAAAPPGAGAPAVHGPRVRALAVDLLHVQHLPLARTADLLADVFGAPVSEGFLVSVLDDAGAAAQPFVDAVRQALVGQPVAHVDETGIRVGGALAWMHTACTPELTLLAARAGRGRAAMDDIGVLADFAGVAVHDGFLPYRKYPARHALGNAHHVRELVAVTERDPAQTWAADLIGLLTAANSAAHRARGEALAARPAAELADLHRRYGDLVAAGLAMNPPPPPTGTRGAPKLGQTGSLLRRLDQRREEVLRFADDLDVPYTNNQAERDLRMTKVQMKISGCWRTMADATTYANLRSYASTIRKNGINALDALTRLINSDPCLPATS